MVYFVSAYGKVHLLICTLLIVSTNSEVFKAEIPNLGVISNFLTQFIKPFIESVQVRGGSPHYRSAKEETSIEKAIRLKLIELKPLLQDDQGNSKGKASSDVTEDNNLTLEGNDETTIIEFVPKKSKKNKDQLVLRNQAPEVNDTFKANINKYKELKKTIIKRLEKEKTANKTKKLITRTLDDMIALLIESKCTWNSVDNSLRKHFFRARTADNNKSIDRLHNLTNQEWKDLRRRYLNFLKSKGEQEDSFLKQFHDFFSNVINDTWSLSDRYKVRCQLVKIDDAFHPRGDKKEVKDQCDVFKVCTDELRQFLSSFYSYVNDTSVSIFRNYAAMYVRDVNVEADRDRDIVVSVLENISNTAERKVSKVYKKEIKKLKLDMDKNKAANIQHITDFIGSAVDQVTKSLKKNLDHELGAMKTKLFATVKDDLSVNLRVDMDNLRRKFKDRMCGLFNLCNGMYAARRHGSHHWIKPKDADKLYVKVRVTLDDELKETMARSGSYAKAIKAKKMSLSNLVNGNFRVDERKYNTRNVTRTTIFTTTESFTRVDTTNTNKTTKSVIIVDGMPLIENNSI